MSSVYELAINNPEKTIAITGIVATGLAAVTLGFPAAVAIGGLGLLLMRLSSQNGRQQQFQASQIADPGHQDVDIQRASSGILRTLPPSDSIVKDSQEGGQRDLIHEIGKLNLPEKYSAWVLTILKDASPEKRLGLLNVLKEIPQEEGLDLINQVDSLGLRETREIARALNILKLIPANERTALVNQIMSLDLSGRYCVWALWIFKNASKGERQDLLDVLKDIRKEEKQNLIDRISNLGLENCIEDMVNVLGLLKTISPQKRAALVSQVTSLQHLSKRDCRWMLEILKDTFEEERQDLIDQLNSMAFPGIEYTWILAILKHIPIEERWDLVNLVRSESLDLQMQDRIWALYCLKDVSHKERVDLIDQLKDLHLPQQDRGWALNLLKYVLKEDRQKLVDEAKNLNLSVFEVNNKIYELARLNIDKFVDGNYEIIDKNVQNLNEAEVICIGEIHSIEEFRKTNAIIIDFLCNNEDLILLETNYNNGEIFAHKDAGAGQAKYVRHNLTMKGWDDRKKITANPSKEDMFSSQVYRNRHLTRVIDKELINHKRIYVIAGAAHVSPNSYIRSFIDSSSDSRFELAYKETVDFLKTKKFVILCPKIPKIKDALVNASLG